MNSEKIERLNGYLSTLGSGLVALSGGVDSSVLLFLCSLCRDFRVEAATVISPAHPDFELAAARKLAQDLKVDHFEISVDLLNDSDVYANGPDRCYYCKHRLYSELQVVARDHGLAAVLDGSNTDDSPDQRPGFRAIRELGIQTPLIQAGFGKKEIRAIARKHELPMWNAPATACLFTRIPTGEVLAAHRLDRIAAAENRMRELGFKAIRVRDHGTIARIEVPAESFGTLLNSGLKNTVIKALQDLGYRYVTLDLSGYRMGSMNTVSRERCIEDN